MSSPAIPQTDSQSRSTHPDPAHIRDRLPFLRRRGLIMRGIRAFLEARDHLEVETPYAVPTPGEEVHL
ncbi:MAG: EF-P lysine aminoacylase GenX, partial [Acetobacter persici]